MVVAAYIEQLCGALAPASVKQHLAALRMLFDWLVVGQVLPFNPASSVRGPKHVVKTGKTPVLSAAETRALLDGIDVSTLAGLRDRALLGVLVYSFARVTAVRRRGTRPLRRQCAAVGGVRRSAGSVHRRQDCLRFSTSCNKIPPASEVISPPSRLHLD